MRAYLVKLGFKLLDITTRSWLGFWGTIAVCFIYAILNTLVKGSIDPFPFVFGMVVITIFSYLQNIVIMTSQKEADIKTSIAEENDKAILLHIHDVVQALHSMMAVQLGHDIKIQKLLANMTEDLEEIQKDLTEDQD